MLRAQREATGASARATSITAGLSVSVVGKIESGAIEPNLRTFALLAQELSLSDREIALLVRLAALRPPCRRLKYQTGSPSQPASQI